MATFMLRATENPNAEGLFYQQLFPMGAVQHCNYIQGLLKAVEDTPVDPNAPPEVIEVPHADEQTIKFICGFLEAHQNDEPVKEGWEKEKPRELTAQDKAEFTPIVGMALVGLLKATNFLGCQMALNATATYVGQIIVTKNEQEVQDYFGVYREFTKEEEEQVKAKYPVPFY